MTQKADRRTQRTRTALMGAFVDLLLGEGWDAVTVERVAERANVGRSTFYLHYTSKDDILKESMTRPSSFFAILVGHDFPAAQLVGILNHILEQRQLNRVFFAPPVRGLWVKCLAEMIEPRLAALVRHTRARPIVPLPLIATQIAEAQLGLVIGWASAKAVAKPEAMAEALIATTRALTATQLRAAPDAQLLIPGETTRVVHRGE